MSTPSTPLKAVFVPRLEACGVVITGGTAGVGLATALRFAEAGVKRIALLGRNAERGETARQTVRAAHPDAQVLFVSADANRVDQVTRAVAQLTAELGSIDVLVNSTVATFVPALFHELPIEHIEPLLVQQMLAPLLMSRAVLNGMRERGGGVIINIASDACKVPTPGESVIGAAMAGITMFSRGLALEAKRNGIRVNTLTPSLIRGTLTYDRVMADPFSAKLFGNAVKQAHLGVVEPDDLAGLIVFLASPQGARLTGQTISVNGGISIA
ncbi:MAG TPA: SDR family oxidoreductase [Methylibium sp.]|nr:SDR family oxidoreductase [Methylibium sp.]